jgi:hypothetical protein
MALDPNIILGVNQQFQQFNPMQGLQQANMLQSLRQQQIQMQTAAQSAQKAQQLNDVLSADGAIDPDTGAFSRNALVAAAKIDPMQAQQLFQSNAAAMQRQTLIEKGKRDMASDVMTTTGDAMATVEEVYQEELDKKGVTPEQARAKAQAIWDDRLKDPEFQQTVGESIKTIPKTFDPVKWAANPKYQEWLLNYKKTEAQVEKADKYMTGRGGAGRATAAAAGAAPGGKAPRTDGGVAGYTSQDIDYLADQYILLQKMPSGVSGRKEDAALRRAIIERAAQKGQAAGGAGAVVATQESLKANRKAFEQNVTLQSAINSAEATAQNEINIVKGALSAGGAVGPQALNRPLNQLRREFSSDKIGPLDTAISSLAAEYIKVLTTKSGAGGGTTTDAARRETERYLNPNLPVSTILANMEIMRRSMEGRKTAIQAEQDRLRSQIGGATITPPAASKKMRYNPATGQLEPM